MNAKEQFEKLGFEYDYVKAEHCEDVITYHKDNLHIQFNLYSKQVLFQNDNCFQFYGFAVFFMSKELLQAINQQILELGW